MRTPLEQTATYWKEARKKKDAAAETMALATVDGEGIPAVRTVLVKGIDVRGFHFVTRARSPKVAHIAAQPLVELCIHWASLKVQIRSRGRVHPMPDDEVESLWRPRPRDAQLLYHLEFAQSALIPSTHYLLQQLADARRRWRGEKVIPRSPWYVGYIIEPLWIEFLYHSLIRLNRRERHTWDGRAWIVTYLAP
ncbi:MAG: pyridoxal 5'-phosphate synthase [Deltaproteobacteria bacterium]|nr:pyridoxal 5'-phosphate synthase [Deltaproteobacteria bacterium]